MVVTGNITRRDGMMNVLVSKVAPLRALQLAPKARDWG